MRGGQGTAPGRDGFVDSGVVGSTSVPRWHAAADPRKWIDPFPEHVERLLLLDLAGCDGRYERKDERAMLVQPFLSGGRIA